MQIKFNKKIPIIIFLSFLQAYFIIDYENSGNPNEQTRVYLTKAIVYNFTFTLDEQFKHYGQAVDRAKFEGHYYTDKAPGSSFLAVPVEFFLKTIEGHKVPLRHSLISYRIFLLLIPTAIMCFFLWTFIETRLPAKPFPLTLTMISYMIGSGALPYTQYFFGHQIVAVLLMATFLILNTSCKYWKILIAGFLAGLCVLTELQSAPSVFLLFILLLLKLQKKRFPNALLFLLPIFICIAAILLYNFSCFKNPFSVGYDHLDMPDVKNKFEEGIAGVTYPNLTKLFLLLFGTQNGLFVFSPLWIFSFPGIYILWKQNYRDLFLIISLIVISWLLFNSSANEWRGGWSVGPRFLVPVLPFLTIPASLFITWSWEKFYGFARPLFAGLAGWGILVHTASVAVHPALDPSLENPIVEHSFYAILNGISRPSVLTLFGFSPSSSFLLFTLLVLITIIYISLCGFSVKKNIFKVFFSIIFSLTIIFSTALYMNFFVPHSPDIKIKKIIRWESERFENHFKKKPVPLIFVSKKEMEGINLPLIDIKKKGVINIRKLSNVSDDSNNIHKSR